LGALLENQIDIELIAESPDPLELLLAVEDHKADVVILTLPFSEGDIGVCSHLLAEYPDLVVLAFAPDSESVCLLRRTIVREQLQRISDDMILQAIRGAREAGG
jgi:DNA-binding NarL/FixJ family response regulator